MINMLKNWNGSVELDGKSYNSVGDVLALNFKAGQPFTIVLHSNASKSVKTKNNGENKVREASERAEKKITVKAYMTKPAKPGFDFMEKFNNNNPMPLRTMVGYAEKETRGMVYMHLHGAAEQTITCMCCGKELTNPISRHYGIGPVCMSKVGIVADINDVEGIKEKLVDVTWEGWVIKSAITEEEEV